MPVHTDHPLVAACRACAREARLLVAELPAGDPLLPTLRACWEVCKRAVDARRYGPPGAAVTFLECCFACDGCADACELGPGPLFQGCAEAFRHLAGVCFNLAVEPESCGA